MANSVGVAYPGISEARIGTLITLIPPLPEQRAIVRYLRYVERRIRRYVQAKKKFIALLTEQKQALVHRAVTRGLDPDVPLKDSGVEWLGDVPAHWDIQRLSTACKFKSGKAHEQFVEDDGKFICVNSRFISTEGMTRKFCASNISPAYRNDVLIVMSDLPNGRALAKAFFVDDDRPYAVNQRVCILSGLQSQSEVRILFARQESALSPA